MANRSCMFEDKRAVRAPAMGEVSLHVDVKGKEASIKVTLKGML